MSTPRELGTARLVLDARATLGECPRWSSRESRLWWVDIAGRAIHRFDPASGHDERWALPSAPGCLAFARSGGLVVALRDGFHRFDSATGRLAALAPAPYDARDFRFNDGRCDAAGRFWAGAMYEPRTHERASMYCLERGALREAWGPAQGLGVKVSNGLAFSADGRALFQSDTPGHVIWRFDFDVATGEARNSPAYGGRPDGACLDRDGFYWSAQYEGGRVLRFAPDGSIDAVLRVPVRRPTMVAFGGPDLATLFVTTAREGASEAELAEFPHSGGLFALETGHAGLPEPDYAD
jgi:sugar lactone lactonase YvrE